MKWFENNPYGSNPSIRQELRFDAHTWGRQTFASNFARGGVTAAIFAPTPGEAFKAGMRRPLRYGSYQHIQNLQRIQAQHPQNRLIKESLQKAKSGVSKSRTMAVLGHTAMGIGALMPMFTTPGSIPDKARATAASLVGWAGWEVGSKVGLAAGAAIGGAIGTAILPGVGTVIGAAVGEAAGWLAGGLGANILFEEGAHALMGVTDRMADRERARRNLNWKNDQTAFMTQSAHTMRQQSLQAMNRGMMNARSMLGREGVMLHQ